MSKPMGWNSAIVFSTTLLAIIPLAGVLGAATEALAEHTGQTVGGLINASFGNATEIIITIDAIRSGLCKVVQAGLIGSMISNLLLVLGMSFMSSGLLRLEQTFNKDGAGANTSCLLVAAIGLSMPTLFNYSEHGPTEDDVLFVSRVVAMVMAVVYCFFLVFQLCTHKHHFSDAGGESADEFRKSLSEATGIVGRLSQVMLSDDEGEEAAVLSPASSTIVLMVSTLVIAQLSELMVDSIEDVSENYGVPKSFIGLILLPIVGNAAEHMTAVVAAFKGKMDLAIGVAVGSSTQIALLVVPFSVMTGLYFDQPMDLNFGPFFTGTFLLTVFLVGSVLQDGSSNWLEGLMLCSTYVMIAIISWCME
jgi:Ca2+:H+ antiporter